MRDGWISTQLKEVGSVVSGGTPKTANPDYWGDEISWITPADLSSYTEKYIAKGRKSITNAGLSNSSAKLMPKGSVLFSSRAPVGYVVIAACELATNQGFKSLIPTKAVDNEYLYYYFKSIKNLAENRASGTTFKELSGKSFSELPISIAPLPEQRAIVSKIEKLFSELDNGIANLKAAKDKLEIYRQAVLKKAFEGELTKEWREQQIDLPSADELLEQIKFERKTHYERQLEEWKQKVKEWEANGKNGKKPSKPKKFKLVATFNANEIEELPELPEKWTWIRINDTVFDTNDDIVDGPFGSNLKNSDFDFNGTVPVIGISNIDEGFKTKIRYVTKEKFDTISRSAVYPGNIIVAKIGSSYGKTGIYPEWMPVGLIPANLLRINPSKHYNQTSR